jgi:hypothetical protein
MCASTGTTTRTFTELDLLVHGSTASGFVNLSDVDGNGVACHSGNLAFTAKRS